MLTRRQFLRTAAGATALTALRPERAFAALSSGAPAALPPPASAPFDHVVVLMMENRSFDHFLGWLPGADGRQAGLAFTDQTGTTYPTYHLAPDYQGCGYADPDHSWEGGLIQLDGGKCDGFLRAPAKDRKAGDTFPVGYYVEDDVPVLGALARNYTTFDRYFASIMSETYPNRFYQHSARTDRDHNMGFTFTSLPSIWDRLGPAGLTGEYYFNDVPFLGLWGDKHATRFRPIPAFYAACASGTLPNVAFVDPEFNGPDFNPNAEKATDVIASGESDGTSGDDHPHADIRYGQTFISSVYQAVRNSPAWDRTVLVINYDEWGGFYDHVAPPKVVDDTTPGPGFLSPGPHPDYRQLGFRVPCVVVSPFAPARIVHDGPYEHTSILRMIEWRWGLAPLTARDANARNLAEVLDFSHPRTDTPAIPIATNGPSVKCTAFSAAARPPQPISGPGSVGGTGGAGAGASGQAGGTTAATGERDAAALVAGAAAIGAGLAAWRVQAKSGTE